MAGDNKPEFPIKEGIEYIKDTSKEKYDASIETHVNLTLEKNQAVNFSISLPYGTGKSKKVAVMSPTKVAAADLILTEDDIGEIESGKIKPKVDFDVLIAHPSFMPKIAKIAKILGPAGTMPNPKSGTVTEDIAEAVQEIKKGKIQVKSEKDAPIIHTIIGKVSFPNEHLVENFNELIKALNQNKPAKAKPGWIKNVYICSSMGQSFRIQI
ncbi:50S ribosomal protein L1 [Patescibacteria group bacterium]|nr:50S ribosomal protein L1 [Patescibacteria group bacterium]